MNDYPGRKEGGEWSIQQTITEAMAYNAEQRRVHVVQQAKEVWLDDDTIRIELDYELPNYGD